jgi:hypothetical protein
MMTLVNRGDVRPLLPLAYLSEKRLAHHHHTLRETRKAKTNAAIVPWRAVEKSARLLFLAELVPDDFFLVSELGY